MSLKKWIHPSWKIPSVLTGIFAVLLLAFAFSPLPGSLFNASSASPVQILDRSGQLLYEFRRGAPGSQEWLPYAKIPKTTIDALIAVEDRTFLTHRGISVRGIARALWQNVTSGRVVSGGSTITQQLVRVRLQSDRNLFSKLLEAYYALRLERSLSKEQILEAYLNSAYFGHQAYGIQAAAGTYFGKSVHELSLSEMSLLIGLLQSPSGYDPFQNLQRARERQSIVLSALLDQAQITVEQKEEAQHAEIRLAADRVHIEAPHFVFWILSRMDLPDDATEIRTTLDLGLQHEVERTIEHHLATLRDKNVTSAAVVVLDAVSGDVLAMVGSADYFDQKHDGAVNVALAPRQPGSAIKPFTYAVALTQGATAATTVADVETQFFTQEGNPYIPRNYDYDEHGLVRYREALANSYNIAAVKVLERVGVPSLLQFLRAASITGLTQSPQHYGLALTLGDAEVTLLELTRAFGVFARQGNTLNERVLLSDRINSGTSILDPSIAWLVSDILSDDQARLPQFGDQSSLNFDFPVAVKTGTTRNSRDNWTVGYTPERIVGVWVGNADNSPMKGTSGVTGAGPIFHDAMLSAMRDVQDEPFARPANIVEKNVCMISGKLPTENCPRIIREKFIAGTEPKESDDIFKSIAIDVRSGLRAGESCPAQYVVKKTFAVFPPDVQHWAREHGWNEPPPGYSPLCGSGPGLPAVAPAGAKAGPEKEWLTITRPADHDEFELDPLVPNKNEKVVLEASASPDIQVIEWSINDVKVGVGKAPDFRLDWQPKLGTWKIRATAGDRTQELRIVVTSATP